ncbi:MAG: hypothetical protein EBU90_12655 [Proteobacteria bacterium]|nr:hypothetical protein [Pseudomonadota bacterium]NBP14845.1 hypothetical protein [bacterium]
MKKIILFVLFSLNNNFIQSAARKPINPPQASASTPSFQDLKNLFETTRFNPRAFNTIFPAVKGTLTLDQIATITRLNSNQKSEWATNIAKILEKLYTQKRQGCVDRSSLEDSLEQEQSSFAALNQLLSDPSSFIKKLEISDKKLTCEEIETLKANNLLGFNDPDIKAALQRLLDTKLAQMLSSLQESLQESREEPLSESSERAVIAEQSTLTPDQLKDLQDALNQSFLTE